MSEELTEYVSQTVSSVLLAPSCFHFLDQQGKNLVTFCSCQYLHSESIMNHILVPIKYRDVALSFTYAYVYPIVLDVDLVNLTSSSLTVKPVSYHILMYCAIHIKNIYITSLSSKIQ